MEAPPIQITADEIHCLIHSYFKDTGFTHSAFALCNEGGLQESPCFNKHIPRGELVELLGKALLYLEVESHWRGDAVTTNCKNRFSLLEHHVCSGESSSVAPLKSPVVSSTTLRPPPSLKSPTDGTTPSNQSVSASQDLRVLPTSSEALYGASTSVRTNGSVAAGETATKRKVSPLQLNGPKEKRAKHESEDMEVDTPVQKDVKLSSNKAIVKQPHPARNSGRSQDASADAPKRAYQRITQSSANDATKVKAVMMLPGHRTEVFVCAFNPMKPSQLATGSRDAVVNLWDLPESPASKNEFSTWEGSPIMIDYHQKDVQGDLTALNWDPEGKLLAVGSYDSVLRILTSEGNPYFIHHQHRGPVFSVRFSPNGRWLLSASLDETACLWDVKEKRLVRQYRCHQDCCLDAEWLDNTTFVTGGADSNMYVMRVDSAEPIKKFSGHTNEINQLKCNSSRTRLASCSDDNTTRIRKVDKIEADSDETIPGLATSDQAVVLAGHIHSVTMIGWMPHRKYWTNEILATSSFDGTARIWDTVTGQCLKVLVDHKRPVYAVAFSPDSNWLATGGGDGFLHVYCTKTWEKRWSWFAGFDKPGVFEIAWQMDSGINRIALALECRQVAVIDVSKISALRGPEEIVNAAKATS